MGMSWAYGPSQRDDQVSLAVIRRAIDLGVTLIDTSDLYGPFTNEELVGKAIARRRDEVVVATKCGLVDVLEGRPGRDGRPTNVRSACDGSLRRLGVDVIDLYQLHRVDAKVPLEDTWGAMSELVEKGKVLALGLSEVSVEQVELASSIHPVASVQSELSLWSRDPLDQVLPWCRSHGVGFLAFSPLGRGFLTGRYASPEAFDAADWRRRTPRFAEEAMTANVAIVERVVEVAQGLGATPAQVSLAWVLAQGPSVVPIPGTKRLAYLEENLEAAEVALTVPARSALDDLPDAVGARF